MNIWLAVGLEESKIEDTVIKCAGFWCFWIMGSKSERIMPKWSSELGDFGFSGSE